MGKNSTSPPNDMQRMPPRERILAAARELFCRRGIRAVGVDAIAQAAATNKMTLYRHFASKDELIAAYLRLLAEEGESVWEALARDHPGDPNAQLMGWVRHVEQIISDASDRGCAIANAAVELREEDHPAKQIIDEYKMRKRNRLAGLLQGAGYADPERLADQCFLLLEGARINRQCCAGGPSTRVAGMLRTLLDKAPRVPKPSG